MLSIIKKFFHAVLLIILTPFIICILFVVLLVWALLTLTGIGPILHYYYSCCDLRLLNRDKLLKDHPELILVSIPADINKASNGKSYSIVARWVKSPTPSIYPPIILPNGLAATQIFLARPQEMLRDSGFNSLTFDRLGCGFSDKNTSGIAPSAVDISREMDFVMKTIQQLESWSLDTKWIGVGGSMGNTVLQAFMALYPDRFLGLLNLDGLPYPYLCESKAFIDSFASQYALFGRISWTGIFRFFNHLAKDTWRKNAESESFSASVILAQMNEPSFFANTVLEFRTMMSCCELAAAGWGDHSLLEMDALSRTLLVRSPPTESVLVDRRKGLIREVTQMRSKADEGVQWATEEEVQRVKEWFLNREVRPVLTGGDSALRQVYSDRGCFAMEGGKGGRGAGGGGGAGGVTEADRVHPLFPQWQQLVVRTMSCRHYGLAGSMAIKPSLVDFSAAEHAQLALLARDGARTVYPQLEHADGFAQSEEIVRFVQQIANQCATSQRV